MKNEIIIFEDEDIRLEVSLHEETVWLTQNQMAMLFKTSQQNISKHINMIFQEKELEEKSVHNFYLYTASDGKKYRTKFYNLDVIISVGYRVNQKEALNLDNGQIKFLKNIYCKLMRLINQD